MMYPLWLRRLTRWTLRLLLASLLVAAAAAAVAWYELGDLDRALRAGPRLSIPGLVRSEVGAPQTILLLGTDERWQDKQNGERGRSDTMMLLRLDPDRPQLSVLSVPRDLRVLVDGQPAKLNSAYTGRGAAGVVETLRSQLGISVNHVFQVDFGAFRGLVDALGCAYTDIDRRYYHRNQPGLEQWSEINLQPGYQRICGTQALEYVRFRHTDSDFVRALRQQDFLHQLSGQFGPRDLLERREQLLDLTARWLRTDLRGRLQIAELLRLLAFCAGKPVVQVPWPGTVATLDGASYVISSPAQIRTAVQRWLRPPAPRPAARGATPGAVSPRPVLPRLEPALRQGRQEAELLARPRWPVWVPTRRPAGSIYAPYSPRAYQVRDPQGGEHPAYRLTLQDAAGHAWGVQGLGWEDPPILRTVHEQRRLAGRTVQLYWDGRRLRLCAWRAGNWWYWISNSLERSLSTSQLLAVCASARRVR